jgi:hypothetical protein
VYLIQKKKEHLQEVVTHLGEPTGKLALNGSREALKEKDLLRQVPGAALPSRIGGTAE